ncbi:MAG TPA: hypothetical protein VNX68_04420 [Nitrosopumilaceae archaeon]|jgi:hypothetical protein|nr:hypothetical protein [Nitrosopumilaceae archaeon]
MQRVTDPELLKRLNSSEEESEGRHVTDPELLKRLNSNEQQEENSNVEKPRERSIFNPHDLLEMLSENPMNPRQQIKAIPQVAEDLKNQVYKAGNWVSNLPQKWKESYELGKKDSSHAARAASAGIPDLAYSLLNIPGNAINYAEKVGLLPKELNKLTKYFNTPDMSKAIGDTVGLTGEKGEELFREALPVGSNIIGGIKPGMSLAKGLGKSLSKIERPAVFNKIDFEKPISEIQSKHDLRKEASENKFSSIQNEAYESGIDKIPDADKIVKTIEDENYLPKSDAFNKLLDKAKTGDYESLRSLQSDLGNFGVSHTSSKLQAERYKGIEMLSLREKINDAIHEHFKNVGRNDLADKLQEARADYKDYIKTYHNTATKTATPATRAISKMVDQNKRLIPKNPEKVFSEISKPFSKFKEIHPELEEMLKKSKNKKSQINTLKNFGVPVGISAASYGAYDILKQLLNK